MPKPAPLPSPLDGRPFLVGTARGFGLTSGRLRSSDLQAPHRGVRHTGNAAESTLARAQAYSPLMSGGQYFSHLTAAELHGLRLPARHIEIGRGSLHVTSIAPHRASRSSALTGHQTSRHPMLVRLEGLVVSHPLQALLDCSEYLGVEDLVVMGDGLLQRKNPLTTLEGLDAAIATHKGRRGARTLARARKLMRPNTDSAPETWLRLLLERASFPETEVNGEIHDEAGAVIAHGTLVFRRHRVVVEYDEGQHRESSEQFGIDVQRIDAIVEHGWRHIRVDKVLIATPAAVVAQVRRAIVDASTGSLPHVRPN